jgi:hypothetical protein
MESLLLVPVATHSLSTVLRRKGVGHEFRKLFGKHLLWLYGYGTVPFLPRSRGR